MDKYEKTIIRRAEVIDEVFYNNLNHNSSVDLIKIVKLDFNRWCRNIAVTTTNNIMLYSFELNPWCEETRYIFHYIYNLIENKYRYKLEEFYNSII